MARRACSRCREVKDVLDFPPVAGAPVCSECIAGSQRDPGDRRTTAPVRSEPVKAGQRAASEVPKLRRTAGDSSGSEPVGDASVDAGGSGGTPTVPGAAANDVIRAKHRAWAAASGRAMRRLAKENPERYKVLLAAERQRGALEEEKRGA